MPEEVQGKRRSPLRDAFQKSPALFILVLVAYVNWFALAAISGHYRGDSIGVRPSIDGFVVTSHGLRTGVTESHWVFLLIYPYCTFMLTPAIVVAFLSRQNVLQRAPVVLRRFVLGFLCIWAIGWYGFITQAFIRSVGDYTRFKHW